MSENIRCERFSCLNRGKFTECFTLKRGSGVCGKKNYKEPRSIREICFDILSAIADKEVESLSETTLLRKTNTDLRSPIYKWLLKNDFIYVEKGVYQVSGTSRVARTKVSLLENGRNLLKILR